MMKGIRTAVMVTGLLVLPAAISAQEGPLSLDDVMRLAANASHAVQIRGHETRKAEWQERSVLSNLGPKLTGSFDWQRFDKEIVFELPTAAQQFLGEGGATVIQPLTNWRATVGVVQPITGLANVALASHLAKLTKDSARIAEALERRNARMQAIDAFFGVLKAEASVRTLQAAERSATAYLDRAKKFHEQGLAKQDDVLRIEVRVEQVRQALATASVGLDVARSRLAMLLGLPLGTPFELRDEREAPAIADSLEAMTSEAVASRWEVRQAAKGVEMARTARALKGMDFLPGVNAIFTWTRTRATSFAPAESWFVGVSASFTAFEWGRRFFDQAAASADVEAAREAAAQVEELIRLEVRASWLASRAAYDAIARAELTVRQARENQRIQDERFRQNLGTTTDLLDAEALVVQAEADRDAAIYGYAAERRKLLESLGR